MWSSQIRSDRRGGGASSSTGDAAAQGGLRAIIAIYSTALGPALGGTRFWVDCTGASGQAGGQAAHRLALLVRRVT